jgi:hypothetical protein
MGGTVLPDPNLKLLRQILNRKTFHAAEPNSFPHLFMLQVFSTQLFLWLVRSSCEGTEKQKNDGRRIYLLGL